jgi:hypothetical protein
MAKKKIKPLIRLSLPEDKALLEAAGRAALAHAHLEHVLRLTIKTLSGMRQRDTLITMNKVSVHNVREVIQHLFAEKVQNKGWKLQRAKDAKAILAKMLDKAAKASGRRNKCIHRPWAKDQNGQLYSKNDAHQWSSPPTAADLKKLANDILEVASEFSEARLEGIIFQISEE